MDQGLLRRIPKVDELLREPRMLALAEQLPAQSLTEALRLELEALRRQILEGRLQELPSRESLCQAAARAALDRAAPSLRPVINGTGVILHTNLGRACLSEAAAQAAQTVARGYSTLEYDLAGGCRGLRYSHVEGLLCRLTGAQAALVVNNNAAAVLLILSALTAGGQVVCSRGELVEIGGSFRVPEIMEACGARLREVGTTNKTHLRDYEAAIGPETRALMKVHTSNYRIVGFTECPSREELARLAHSRGLPLIEDLGSGCLADLRPWGIHDEPTVGQCLAAGVDVLSFSGDKLLGGPQAGIILGSRELLDRLKAHPLTRAMRVDKMTLAALEATLRSYEAGRATREIPTLAMLAATEEELRQKAELLCRLLQEAGCGARVCPCAGQMGGGSVPTKELASYAVELQPRRGSAQSLEAALRAAPTPIIGRIHHDRCLLDVRTLRREDFGAIVSAVQEAEL